MALDEYWRKRDFSKTPEPRGAGSGRETGATRFFCVQKHLASHLHYDFRLEHEGVLLSWAVPKGPAIDPSVKRLAMHVEDHPIEYGTFEGVIPDGYGAGIVMLWDQGTWEPEVPDVAASLRRGDLKFRLNGVKLKGSWALVRTRGAGERSWLLLKHRDEWSGPLDIAAFAPHSVKSGGDFADILASDDPAIWQSNRPARTGATGQMFARIIERAVALREEERGAATSGPGAQTLAARPAAGPGPAEKRRGARTETAKASRRPAGATGDGTNAPARNTTARRQPGRPATPRRRKTGGR
jgi:bifunctional non-homologous end joining protein LigD